MTQLDASTTTLIDTVSAIQQADVYEAALRDVYARAIPSLPPEQRGILIVDHAVDGAGELPLTYDQTTGGDQFTNELMDELSLRLADLPFLGFVESTRNAIGPDRPGLLTVVSPIELRPDGATVGVELRVYPGAGEGRLIVVSLSDSATIVDSRPSWVS